MATIFVSYRRADSDVIAGRIRDRLARSYGDASVFMDIDNIPFGVDFRTHVQDVLHRGEVMVAVIGPNWLGRDEAGRSRLDDETDPVRLELDAALRNKMPIIPVLVHDAKMPKPGDLPPTMRDFAFYNAADIDSGRDFHPHMDRLIRSIQRLLGNSISRPRQRLWLVGGGLGLVGLVAAALVLDRTKILPLWPPTSTVSGPDTSIAERPQVQQQPPTSKDAQVRWRAFHSIGLPELRSTVDDLRKNGFHPKTISGFLVDGVPHYALLWTREQRPANTIGWEYDGSAVQKRDDELAKSGLRPVFISAYEGPFGTRYADVWERTTGSEWVLRREMTAEALRAAVSEQAKQGLHLASVYGYVRGGVSNFAAIFEKRTGEPTIVSIDTPAMETQKDWDIHIKQGYRPIAITGYRVGQADYLSTLWGSGPAGSSRFGLPASGYDAYINERTNQGMRFIFLTGYSGLGGTRYNLIWTK